MSTEAIRLRLYAIMGAVEEDLRGIYRRSLLSEKSEDELFHPDIYSKLVDRRNADADFRDIGLYHYADMGDMIAAISRNAHLGGENLHKHIKAVHRKIESLIPIRNRVMHVRPLLFDDLPTTAQTARYLVQAKPVFWNTLRETSEKLEKDDSYLLRIEFKPDGAETHGILNNLPLPEFDDTGFIGRDEESSKIKKALLGAYPVVTITGEGGLGKTALALKVCYDLVDDPTCPFEAIIWTSAKTTRLTTKEIIQIEDAVSSSVGIFEAAADFLDEGDQDDPMTRLIDQLESFPILLVIDNLETVLDENIRALVQDVPTGSKILFTTKRSIGAYDFPVPLGPLTIKESNYLFRALSRFWGQDALASLDNQKANEYCRRLQNNPLIIKWFVQAVAEGQSPQKLSADPKLVLKYCLSSVFDKLSDDALRVISSIAFDGRGLTEAAVCYFTDLDPDAVQSSLGELIASNLVRMSSIADQGRDPVFTPSEMAMFYIRNYAEAVGIDEVTLVKKRRNLAYENERSESLVGVDPFDFNNIALRDDSDLVVTRLLKEALQRLKSEEYRKATELAERAKTLSPNYFEVDRTLALIFSHNGLLMKADAKFQSAISLNPGHAPLRVWYGDFLLKRMDDVESAEQQYSEAIKIAPDSIETLTAYGLIRIIAGDFDGAEPPTLRALQVESFNPRKRKRAVDVRLKFYTRKIEALCEAGEMESALSCLGKFKIFLDSCDLKLIDSKMIDHGRKIHKSVSSIVEFYTGTAASEQSEDLRRWFISFFSGEALEQHAGGASVDFDIPEGIQIGRICQVHSKYGFIDFNGSQVLFHFGEWLESENPSVESIGTTVTFFFGRNDKGVCATRIQKTRQTGAPSSANGVLATDKGTFGFINGDDGQTYFISNSHLVDSSVQGSDLVGRRLAFDVSDDKKGKYFAARHVVVVD